MSKPTDTEMLDWLQGRCEVVLLSIGFSCRLSWLDSGKDLSVRAYGLRTAIAAAMAKQRKDEHESAG